MRWVVLMWMMFWCGMGQVWGAKVGDSRVTGNTCPCVRERRLVTVLEPIAPGLCAIDMVPRDVCRCQNGGGSDQVATLQCEMKSVVVYYPQEDEPTDDITVGCVGTGAVTVVCPGSSYDMDEDD